jgi:hypothetical protein
MHLAAELPEEVFDQQQDVEFILGEQDTQAREIVDTHVWQAPRMLPTVDLSRLP